eukprot:scaffold184_cov379-Prasinococcus_capsulatus_cf.AAC.5
MAQGALLRNKPGPKQGGMRVTAGRVTYLVQDQQLEGRAGVARNTFANRVASKVLNLVAHDTDAALITRIQLQHAVLHLHRTVQLPRDREGGRGPSEGRARPLPGRLPRPLTWAGTSPPTAGSSQAPSSSAATTSPEERTRQGWRRRRRPDLPPRSE